MDTSRDDAASEVAAGPRRPAAAWVLLLAMWTAFALIIATQHYLSLRDAERPVEWLPLFGRQAQLWGTWALLAPLVFAAARRFPVAPGNVLRGVMLHVPLAIGFILLHALITGPVVTLLGWYPLAGSSSYTTAGSMFVFVLRANVGANLLVYALLVALYHVITYGSTARAREVRASQLEAQLARARLDVLQMQLQPHFLFNTLHAVSALMERDTAAARRMLTQLSDLLRLSLTDPDTQEVRVEEEISFLGRYIDIQRMRFHDRLAVDVEVDAAAQQGMVPRLVIQPLVENAIRHGIATRTGPGRVAVAVHRRDGELHLSVTDNGRGLPPGGMQSLRLGVGLRNTVARLQHLYGERGRFELTNAPDGGTVAHISIPYREGSAG